jgi:hypothetical protein
MKITKQGTIKLNKNDLRTGNFIWSKEKSHIVVQDINTLFKLRISRNIACGQVLELQFDDKKTEWLHVYVSIMLGVCCTVPDNEYLEGLISLAEKCTERNKNIYYKEGETDDEALQRVKEVQEAVETIQNATE